MHRLLSAVVLLALPTAAQDALDDDPFRQLEEILPTPTEARLASGAPGPAYWQQKVDYEIDVEIDDVDAVLSGRERITYHNNSPHTLTYLWVQLDNNAYSPDSARNRISRAPGFGRFPFRSMERQLAAESFDGGVKLHAVVDEDGDPLRHVVNGTMLRIDLPEPLESGDEVEFEIEWSFAINESKFVRARTGYEHFDKDGNNLYEMAHWFPRLAPYEDVNGWQNKQFLGSGEFALEFGDYLVRISVPDDHIVAASGVLQNPEDVLSDVQRERLDEAREAERPVMIVTKEEAIEAENGAPNGKKTWIFEAENVRDFAFASSRKFLWDALGVDVEGETVMAMSFWPKEGEPLWSRYSTHAIAHTLDVYGKFTFPYPYPVAISVNGPVGGMEYPMICFNGPRPEEDGTYSARTKYGLISVIIHEVGHNFFPMIVNSDERQWTWMDEGLNTFCQFLAEQEWEEDYPSRRGEAARIASYLASDNRVPIMTNSESLLQFGNNAYAAPATALNVLRETIMGRELFDFAFAEYSRRWAFKRPMPADLFRTMEDASAVDLDWFWRGWFYSTDHVDLALAGITQYLLDTEDPDIDKVERREERDDKPTSQTDARNEGMERRVEHFPELIDFYNEFDELDVTEADRRAYQKLIERLEPRELELLALERFFYVVEIENLGGLVMPVILEVETADGATAEHRIPAEIWARNDERVKKLLMTESEIVRITLDPHLETADYDLSNNAWPPELKKTRFELFKEKKGSNPMRKAREEEERAKKKAEGDAGDGEEG